MSSRPPLRPRPRGGLRLGLGLVLASAGGTTGSAPPAVVATGLQFAEGTIVVGDTLHLVDHGASDVRRLVGGRLERVWHGDGGGTNGLPRVPQGLMVACLDGGTIETITLAGKAVGPIDRNDVGQRFQGLNDVVADRKGGVYLSASARDDARPAVAGRGEEEQGGIARVAGPGGDRARQPARRRGRPAGRLLRLPLVTPT